MPIFERDDFDQIPGTVPTLGGLAFYISGSDVNVQKYETTIYEMGFSTKDPLSGLETERNEDKFFDFSGNVKTFENKNGLTVDLANGKSIDLSDGTNTRPPNGDYPYAYIIIDNTFNLRGSVQHPEKEGERELLGGWYTASRIYGYSGAFGGNETLIDITAGGRGITYLGDDDDDGRFESAKGNPLDFTYKMIDFEHNYGTGTTSQIKIHNLDSGVLKKWAPDPRVTAGPRVREEGIDEKIVISFKPNSPYKVTKSTKGINVTFDVTNSGMEVLLMDNGGGLNDRFVTEMDFAPIITLIE